MRNIEWGTLKNLSAIIATTIVILGLLGYVYSFGQAVNKIDAKLDRNCRFLAVIEADTRFAILQDVTDKVVASTFREIYRNSLQDACG